MKGTYYHRLSPIHSSMANVDVGYDVWGTPNDSIHTITRINVPRLHRGKGHGSQLLKEIIEDADRTGQTLQLGIHPSGEMSYDELKAWYERYGFLKVEGASYMERPGKTDDYND